MRYRLGKILGPGCVTYGRPRKSFEKAYSEYLFEDTWTSSATVFIQEERDGGWATLSRPEIARLSRKVKERADFSIMTEAYTYRFKLPKKVDVPSDLGGWQAFAYIVMSLLCDGMAAEPRDVKGWDLP